MNRLILTMILALCTSGSFAQVDFKYLDHRGSFNFGGGMVFPGNEMKSTYSNGLYAKNGFQVFAELNYIIKYGLGTGLNIEYDQFPLNKTAFMNAAKPDSMNIKGGYTSTKVGLNILINIPVVVKKDKFTLNIIGKLTPGIRGFNIPNIDLYYSEIINKYVEVSYRPRKNYMTYIGYGGGIQTLFNNKWGINLSYNAILKSRHSIDYSVRMFDAFGNLTEGEKYLNNYLDHSGWQLSLLLLLGKK